MFSLILVLFILFNFSESLTLESIPFSDDLSLICVERKGKSLYVTIPYYLLSCRNFSIPESPLDLLNDRTLPAPLTVEWIQHISPDSLASSVYVAQMQCHPPAVPLHLPVTSPNVLTTSHVPSEVSFHVDPWMLPSHSVFIPYREELDLRNGDPNIPYSGDWIKESSHCFYCDSVKCISGAIPYLHFLVWILFSLFLVTIMSFPSFPISSIKGGRIALMPNRPRAPIGYSMGERMVYGWETAVGFGENM